MTAKQAINRYISYHPYATKYIYHAPNDASDDLAQLDGLTCFIQNREYRLFNTIYLLTMVVFPWPENNIIVHSRRMHYTDLEKI